MSEENKEMEKQVQDAVLIHQLLKDVRKIVMDVQKEKHISAKRFVVSVLINQKLIIKMQTVSAAT